MPSRKPIATARVRTEWQRRIGVEYHSAAISQHLGLWLIQMGASPDLVRLSARIVDDELLHAELAAKVTLAAGGEPTVLDRATLTLKRDASLPLEHDVLRACLGTFCLGETVAVPLFAALRGPCTVPVARRALDRILRDEVRHRDFGWTLLGWLLEQPSGAELRSRVTRELPAYLATLRATYDVAGHGDDACDEGERAWGIMPRGAYRDVLRASIKRGFLPRFAKLGIDARALLSERS